MSIRDPGSGLAAWPAPPAREEIRLPAAWLALVLSLVIHSLLLWGWHIQLPQDDKRPGDTPQPLRLRLSPEQQAALTPPAPPRRSAERRTRPAPKPPASPPVGAAPAPVPSAPAPAIPERDSRPPVLSAPAPAPATPTQPPAPQPSTPSPPIAAAPRTPAPAGDFSAMLEARRREREAQSRPPAAEPEEDERTRHNRIVAQNIAPPNAQVFGYDPRQTGGVFQVESMYSDRAEFLFYGWNKDVRRRTPQRIEVRRGNNPDIRVAIVRRMIAIIRDFEQGDFTWYSERLGRNISLSARPADNTGLEDFLVREFFPR